MRDLCNLFLEIRDPTGFSDPYALIAYSQPDSPIQLTGVGPTVTALDFRPTRPETDPVVAAPQLLSAIGPNAACTSECVAAETILDLVDHRIELLVFLPLVMVKQQALPANGWLVPGANMEKSL